MTALAHLSSEYRRTLAPEAAAQRDARDRSYPALIRTGKVREAAALADFQAWAAIHIWLSTGRRPAWCEWPAMIAAAERARDQGRKAAAAKADDDSLAARCAQVEAIAATLAAHAGWLAETNAALRAQADAARAARSKAG